MLELARTEAHPAQAFPVEKVFSQEYHSYRHLILKIILSKNLVEHDLDVVAGVPVAVVIKAAGLFEDAGELHAARAHVVNVSLGVLVAVFKGTLLLGLAP